MATGGPNPDFDRVTAALSSLGAHIDDPPDERRRAFLAAAKSAHPDRPGGDAVRMRAVLDAWRIVRTLARPAHARETVLRIPVPVALYGGWVKIDDNGRSRAHHLPPGHRNGDRVGPLGACRRILISGDEGLSVLGDDLHMTQSVDRGRLDRGGRIALTTPGGARHVWLAPGLAGIQVRRIEGAGLPATAARPAGALMVRLIATDAATAHACGELERFTRTWLTPPVAA